MKKALITQTAIFVGWLALALTLALGGPVGCSKKKDRNQSGHVVFPHHNPNGLTPIPRRGIVTGSGQTSADPSSLQGRQRSQSPRGPGCPGSPWRRVWQGNHAGNRR